MTLVDFVFGSMMLWLWTLCAYPENSIVIE